MLADSICGWGDILLIPLKILVLFEKLILNNVCRGQKNIELFTINVIFLRSYRSIACFVLPNDIYKSVNH